MKSRRGGLNNGCCGIFLRKAPTGWKALYCAAAETWESASGFWRMSRHRNCLNGPIELCRALSDGREYDLLVSLAPLEGNRDQFADFLSMVDRLVCETAKAGFVSSSREAVSLAARLSPGRAVRVHQLGNEMRRGLKANVSLSLLLAVYSSGLKTIMET